MKFLVCLVLLAAVWQASAQAPGDEDTRCEGQREPYPPNITMLMDSRNYEQLITGSSAVWQAVDVDGTGNGVSGCVMPNILLRKKLCCYCACLLIYHNICFPSACSGVVHLVVCALLSRGRVISELVHHKRTGSSHSTSVILLSQRTSCLWISVPISRSADLRVIPVVPKSILTCTAMRGME